MHAASHDEIKECGVMRSLLVVPGETEKNLEQGRASEADMLLVDLEDAVSAERKAAARQIAADFLTSNGGTASPGLYVRINDLSSGFADGDLAAIMPSLPVGILLP